MESLSQALSQFDQIEINCLVHGIPSIGLCAVYDCAEEPAFLCMKCVEEGNSCITRKNHELISLSEILYRFFVKQENKKIDLMEINSLIEVIKEIDQRELLTMLSNFISQVGKSIGKLNEEINDSIKIIIKRIIKEYKDKIKKIENSIQFEDNELSDIDIILNINPSLFLLNHEISRENLTDFMFSHIKTKSDKDKLINDIKKLNNFDKVEKTLEKIDSLNYVNKIINNESKSHFEKSLDFFFANFEEEIDIYLNEIEKTILPQKNPLLLLTNTNSIQKFTSNPTTLTFKKDICDNAHKTNSIDSVFTAFKSIKGESLIIWGTCTNQIQIFDLNIDKVIKTIPSAHSSTIFACRHYNDQKNKRDLVITSSYDRSIKVWCVNDHFENILMIPKAHSGYYIYSVCIACDINKGNNYVISAAPNEQMKVWDFKGKKERSFGVSNESTYFVDVFYEGKKKKYYILNANSNDVKVYIFETGELYKKYKGLHETWHMSVVVFESEGVLKLVESDGNGNIGVWDFHLGSLIKTIPSVGIVNLRGICLWNDEFLFSSGSDSQVKLYNLKEGKFIKNYSGHNMTVCSIKKIIHPNYGECLISHGLDGKLKIWVMDNKI